MFESKNPKEIFYVARPMSISDAQDEVLTKLYQPLVGAVALSLYHTLAKFYSEVPIASSGASLMDLQRATDLDLTKLFAACHRLEAAGLLKTYVKTNPVLGETIIFQLIEVPSAAEFFDTFLLSSLLLEKIGDKQFDLLVASFKKSEFAQIATADEVTASFFDVFHVESSSALEPPVKVVQAKHELTKADEQPAVSARVDWKFLKELFAKYHVSSFEVDKNMSAISDVIDFYHLSEVDFVGYAVKTLSASETKLNMKNIQRLINQEVSKMDIDQEVGKLIQTAQNQPVTGIKLNAEEQALLQTAKELEPQAFLAKIKQEKGGYVAHNERAAVFYLISNNKALPAGLVNILIKVCLDYSPVLTRNLIDRILNDWLQKGIATPEAALEYTRNFASQKQRGQKSSTPVRVVEKATDWSKKAAKPNNKYSDQELKALLRKLSHPDEQK